MNGVEHNQQLEAVLSIVESGRWKDKKRIGQGTVPMYLVSNIFAHTLEEI